MRPIALVALAAAALLPLRAQETTAKKRLAFADLGARLQWTTPEPSASFAPDGTVRWREGERRVVFDPAARALVTTEPAAQRDGDAALPAGLPGAVRWRATIHEGDVYVEPQPPDQGPRRARRGAGRRGGEPGPQAVRLTTDGATTGARTEAHASDNGASASFVCGNDLFAVDVGEQATWRITQDGGAERFHGVLDWVYQEEVYGRGNFQGHWWSPDGGMLAFLSLDESPVREFTVVNHVPEGFLERDRGVVPETTNYPKAGDGNPLASLSVAHPRERRVVPVALGAFPADALIVRVEWTPDGGTLLATVQDRIQTWAALCAVDPATGKATPWIREESPTWVERPQSPRWLPDGTFLWLSERTGYQHVYRYRRGGELVNAVTAGDWQVRAIERVDETKGLLWFEGTKGGATGRHLYRIGLDGTGLVDLTPGVGTHRAVLRDDGAFVIDTWSAMDRLPCVRVLDGATGEVVTEIGQAGLAAAATEYEFAPRQRLTIRARDGYELDASLMEPTRRREGARFPVFLPTYSGPDAPSVRDAWAVSTWHQFLCQQGFAVLQVNVRSASGRGRVHAGTCYKQLGVQELQDLEDAVDFVCRERGGDPARVAIQGWSYGGFMAAYALTHSTKFTLGLAGAGVYDWRLYDTIYTERYLRTPQENAAGYAASSVIANAKNLHGHLVLVHGTMDDNVHLQNTMQLLWALQTAGVQDFELMLYPRSRHGLAHEVAAHHQEFEWRALQRLLR